jgi:hypothetical protein
MHYNAVTDSSKVQLNNRAELDTVQIDTGLLCAVLK